MLRKLSSVTILSFGFISMTLADDTPVQAKPNPIIAKADKLIVQASKRIEVAGDKRLRQIEDYLDQKGKGGALAFANRLLGLKSKWTLVRAQVSANAESEYSQWMVDEFARLVFDSKELETVIESAVKGFTDDVEAIENQLAVDLGDIVEDAVDTGAMEKSVLNSSLRSSRAILDQFKATRERVRQKISQDLQNDVTRELMLFVVEEVATVLVQKVAIAISARLGVSATILGVGASSSAFSFGAGIVIGFVLDVVVNKAIHAAGYRPELDLAEAIQTNLNTLGETITRGDAEARADHAKLKQLLGTETNPKVRQRATEVIKSIEKGSRMHGLHGEFMKIRITRILMIRNATQRMLKPSSTPSYSQPANKE